MPAYKILLMGASYGSLLASKLLFGGHSIHLVCLPAEADLINAEGFKVTLPVRGRKDPVLLESRKLPGKVTARPARGVDPKDYDLVGLCMQEPQYRSPGVRELLDAVGKSRVPCMSIMNMPPLPYIKRIPGLDYKALEAAYTDPRVWDSVSIRRRSRSTAPIRRQSARPTARPTSCWSRCRPISNARASTDDKDTQIIRNLEKDVDAARFDAPEGKIELPVKLKVYESIFVPLAKWSMLLAGNYRCVTKDGMRTAQEAVHCESRGIARRLQLRVRSVREARRQPERPRPVREIRRRRAKPVASGLGGAGLAERRAQYRARRQAGAADRRRRAWATRRSMRRSRWSTSGSTPTAKGGCLDRLRSRRIRASGGQSDSRLCTNYRACGAMAACGQTGVSAHLAPSARQLPFCLRIL